MAAALVASALLLATCMWQMDSPVKKIDGESSESWDDYDDDYLHHHYDNDA